MGQSLEIAVLLLWPNCFETAVLWNGSKMDSVLFGGQNNIECLWINYILRPNCKKKKKNSVSFIYFHKCVCFKNTDRSVFHVLCTRTTVFFYFFLFIIFFFLLISLQCMFFGNNNKTRFLTFSKENVADICQ